MRTKQCRACGVSQNSWMFRKDKSNCMPCELYYAKHEIANLKRKMETMSAPRNRWTDAQLSILIHVLVYEDGTIQDASKLCGRSVDICRAKADLLGIDRKTTQPINFHSNEEIAKVHYCLYVKNLSTYMTARALKYKSHNVVIGINNRHIKPDPSVWAGLWSPPADFSWPVFSAKERASRKSLSSLASMVRNKS